jgi:hypothetical protein
MENGNTKRRILLEGNFKFMGRNNPKNSEKKMRPSYLSITFFDISFLTKPETD